MPYEPIRCPTCGSTKTIAAENKRFFCASCDGWFVWTDATHAKETEPPSQQSIDVMQDELNQLRDLVQQLKKQSSNQQSKPNRQTKGSISKSHPKFSDGEIARQNMLEWYYLTEQHIHGPFSFHDILSLNRKGVVSLQTSISNDREKWITFGDFADKKNLWQIQDDTDGNLILFFILGCIGIAVIVLLAANP